MATTKTTRLNLAKQDPGDPSWDVALDQGFDDADARLLTDSEDNEVAASIGAITPVTGALDPVISGTYDGGRGTRDYYIWITEAGAQDKYRWSRDGIENAIGTSVNVTNTPVLMENGLSVAWPGAITGRALADTWRFKADDGLNTNPNFKITADYNGQRYLAHNSASGSRNGHLLNWWTFSNTSLGNQDWIPEAAPQVYADFDSLPSYSDASGLYYVESTRSLLFRQDSGDRQEGFDLLDGMATGTIVAIVGDMAANPYWHECDGSYIGDPFSFTTGNKASYKNKALQSLLWDAGPTDHDWIDSDGAPTARAASATINWEAHDAVNLPALTNANLFSNFGTVGVFGSPNNLTAGSQPQYSVKWFIRV